MDKILHIKPGEVTAKHKKEHEGYEYNKFELVKRKPAGKCVVSMYEVPPGKSAYPYHFHTQNEEAFYIISGSGTLRTPEGEKPVCAGEFMYFPANENGAHKLTNTSSDETLVYLDFDTASEIDVAFYTDSDKIGIWGKDINKLFESGSSVDYYKGE